jgi:uncharacterized protein YdhG (YjbR/CyaY superfamily)
MRNPNAEGSVDGYIRSFPRSVQVKLRAMRAAIREAAPEAVEKISYGMPCFFLRGNLVYFAAFSRHIGFYPTASGVAHFQKEISGYRSSKGAIQIPLDEPLPIDLIQKITRFRVKENSTKPAHR